MADTGTKAKTKAIKRAFERFCLILI